MPESKGLGGGLHTVLEELEKRVTKIEGKDEKTHFRLTTLEEKYEKLSDTITSENRETRATMRDTTDKLFAIISSQSVQQSTAEEREFNLEREKEERAFSLEREKIELRKMRTNLWITNIFKLLGTGGILYVVIEAIITK